MSEIKYKFPADLPKNLDDLEQIAIAAGHGHGHKPISEGHPSRMQPTWFSLEDNCRPSYDIHFLQTFNPDTVAHLINRLRQAEAE